MSARRPEFYSEQEMAEILRIEVKTLRSRRARGTDHPPYIRIGRDTLYPKEPVQRYLDSRPMTWEVRSVG